MVLLTTARDRRRPAVRAAWRTRVLTAGALLVVAGSAACSAPAQAPSPPAAAPAVTPTLTDTATPTPTPEPPPPAGWPLIGVVAPDVVVRPAVSVKVENSPVARPQSGLDAADVVWETIVEYDVSRLVAVFHSQVPDEVGPIRSVRPVDPLILSPVGGLLAFSGGQPGILDLVADSPVQPLNDDDGVGSMYRMKGRAVPHNLYGSVESFLALADEDHRDPPPEQFAFAPQADLASPVVDGTPASVLTFRLSAASSPAWTWDETTGSWLRSEGSKPALVADGGRIAAVNVVSITAPHPPSPFGAQGGQVVPTYDLIGEGQALVASGGRTLPAVWRKDEQDTPLRLFAEDGTPVLLAPGNTWVELVPADRGTVAVR